MTKIGLPGSRQRDRRPSSPSGYLPRSEWRYGGLLLLLVAGGVLSAQAERGLSVSSHYLRAVADPGQPGLQLLSVDSLGGSQFKVSPLRIPAPNHLYRVKQSGGTTLYYVEGSAMPVWEIRVEDRSILFRSRYFASASSKDLSFNFDPDRCHATLLGLTTTEGDVTLPALLHLPGMGSLRITSPGSTGLTLDYHSRRRTGDYVNVGLRAATHEHPEVSYRFDVVALSPALLPASNSLPLAGFRRDYLDGLQLNAQWHVLANNAASDACAFTLYEAADISMYAPPLANGLRALDLVRETLDRYLEGFKGYGMPGFKMFDMQDPSVQPYTFLDTYPSLLISAYDYVTGTHDKRWLEAHYSGLQTWAELMLKDAAEDTGLLTYPASGNSGSWTQKTTIRPANWWDTIGFGHEDAWSNALGYRALRSVAAMAKLQGDVSGEKRYMESAARIKANYVAAFFDPETGLLAGWRSADGRLHDYQFLFVNGAAVRYGLLDEAMEASVAKEMLRRIHAAGYTRFDLGLPGNLIPVRRADYVDLDPRYGGPVREDGSDGFQIYENGGSTAAFAYFTIAALYRTGHGTDADAMLVPMLNAFAEDRFSGRGAGGYLTNDWKDWHGGPHGYEGFLADNYYLFLCVLEREHRGPVVP